MLSTNAFSSSPDTGVMVNLRFLASAFSALRDFRSVFGFSLGAACFGSAKRPAISRKIGQFGTGPMLALAVLLITWIWSVSSANAKVKTNKMAQALGKIERPTPPGEGNFEL